METPEGSRCSETGRLLMLLYKVICPINEGDYPPLTACLRFCVSIMVGTLFLGGCCDTEVLSTRSPDAIYNILVTKEKRASIIVLLDVHHLGEQLLKDIQLDSVDMWCDFENKYPEYEWLEESMLHLYKDKSHTLVPDAHLLVKNDTGSGLTFLAVKAGSDFFLLLDLPPESVTSLEFKMNPWLDWIEVTGQRARGGESFWEGMNFRTKEFEGSSARFEVSVGTDYVKIQSPDVEGYPAGGIPSN